MFKLESYVAPLLMGYIDKYIKLKKDDFQVSLWGGDVVLNKLELRLDEIEKLINLPISLRSGWVHELRVHVPWTHLYSEPVVITINTIECTVKLKSSDSSSSSQNVSGKNLSQSVSLSSLKKAKSTPTFEEKDDLPPGYLQSLINKILNNMNIIVNNLILKFVDDDIVLSLNVKSAECYSVDAAWNRAFIELTQEDLVLRRILEVHDLTLCLDQRNASGKIDHYQAPLLYKCALVARLHMAYESIYSKTPMTTRLNVLCETVNFSMTDIQLPLFYRLIQLVISFHYAQKDITSQKHEHGNKLKNVDVGTKSSENDEDSSRVDPNSVFSSSSLGSQAEEEGWLSWAWSYVPPILPLGSGSDLDSLMETRRKIENSVFIFGFYVRKLEVTFKVLSKCHLLNFCITGCNKL
ncbi:hypothetical protein HELRODRAFT_65053 [Helobdella robusta]|uniref:Chorein N-terminal domain-containing protein n=1 Tax=Helobdella robusta TaxID=6412 RepID=T1FY25_HELRO|nr:hypothetical protein HELRODRAFT_65053 [Helobdella robusta]ESO06524.1 hypothetical protein HELRODRAFT_65053 [Helobdella robusta]